MKKVGLIVLAVLFCLTAVAVAECPAPFQKAKEMALRAPVDSRGNHLVRMVINKNGEATVYIIGFLPRMAQIGIGFEKNGELTVYVYNEYLRTFTKVTWKEEIQIDPNECIAEANKIFRLMVIEQLI